MDKEQELYQEEIREELIRLNNAVDSLKILTEKQLENYTPPKDNVQITGKVLVNTEKEVAITNIESIRDYLVDFSKELTTAIEKSVREPVEEVKIKNITDARTNVVKVSNIKDLATEFEKIRKSIDNIKPAQVNVEKQEVVFPRNANQAIAVRLSDGKSFYNAITSAVSGIVASFVDQTNKTTSVQLTSTGRVPVELGVSPTIDIGDIQIKNASGTVINPSTEEKQNDIVEAIHENHDLFGSQISGSRYNQVEIDFALADPDSISDLTITKANGGDATLANGQAVFSTSAATNGSIKAVTKTSVIYRPHAESYAAFTAIYTNGVANSFQRIGIYDNNNGFFIGYEGISFGLTIRQSTSDNRIAQSSFNVDTLSGGANSKYTRNGIPEIFDPTKDNLYRIRYGWLGASGIYFEVLSPDQTWVVFHIHRTINTAVIPSIANPNLPIKLEATKTSGSTNIIINTACWAGGTTSNFQKITDTLTNNTLATLNRSVITGQTTGGGGGYVNVKVNPSGALAVEATISGTVATTSPTYKTLIDETTTPSVTYLGKAAIGTATTAASWQISKIDESGSVTSITWSGSGFTAIWDNRTSISYT
jgi:hypothetical protein